MKTFPQKCEWSHLGESGQVVPGGVMRTSGNFFFFLPWEVVRWVYSLCDNLLSCMSMICALFHKHVTLK